MMSFWTELVLTTAVVGSSASASIFLLKSCPKIILLRDRIIDTMLAVAAAFMSPVSVGRRVGTARNAMFAVNRTAACVSEV